MYSYSQYYKIPTLTRYFPFVTYSSVILLLVAHLCVLNHILIIVSDCIDSLLDHLRCLSYNLKDF